MLLGFKSLNGRKVPLYVSGNNKQMFRQSPVLNICNRNGKSMCIMLAYNCLELPVWEHICYSTYFMQLMVKR